MGCGTMRSPHFPPFSAGGGSPVSPSLGAFFVSKCSQLASIIRLDGRKNAEIEGIHVRLTRLCLVLIDYALAH